jgi:hypothetical protein
MMTLPNGYRWINEIETECFWYEADKIMVHDSEFPEHVDVALPIYRPVAVEAEMGAVRWSCVDEFGEHSFHSDECQRIYEDMSPGYPGDGDLDDIEYKNYMYGSSRY